LRDNASLLLFRIGLRYGSVSFPIEPRPLHLLFFIKLCIIKPIEYRFSELKPPKAQAMAINRWVWGEIPTPPVLERKMLIDHE